MDAFVHCDIPPSVYAKVHAPNAAGSRDNHLDPKKRAPIDKWVAELKAAIKDAVQPCLQRIKELDEDDEKYKKMISTSLLPGNEIKRGGFWDIATYGKRIRDFLQEGEVFGR